MITEYIYFSLILILSQFKNKSDKYLTISIFYFFDKDILLHTSCSLPIRVRLIPFLGGRIFQASGKGSAVKMYKCCLDLEMGQETLSFQSQMAAAKQLHVVVSLDHR